MEPKPKSVATNVPELRGNPYIERWSEAAARAGQQTTKLGWRAVLRGTDWVHLQWPERVFDPRRMPVGVRLAALLSQCAIARVRGSRVLLTVHNVYSHSNRYPRLERLLWRTLEPLTTDVHLLSIAGADEVYAAHPGLRRARRHIVPMGDYGAVTDPAAPTRERARAQLGLGPRHTIVVSFGSGRRYKGYPELVRAFSALAGPDHRLVIAGRLQDEGLGDELRAAADERLILVDRYLEQAELDGIIRAADLVVLPYRRILNSASAMLALAHARRILVPATATFAELRERVGPGWVHSFHDGLTSADVQRALAAPVASAPPALDWAGWDVVSEGIGRMLGS